MDKIAELAASMGVTAPPRAPPIANEPTAAVDSAVDSAELSLDPEVVMAPTSVQVIASAQAGEMLDSNNEISKKLRALAKKLRAVDDLIEKQKGGTELNADQLAKVAARKDIEAEIARWEALDNMEELNKEIKKLGKKLRQIDELKERATKGETLNADQNGKIGQYEKLALELANLKALAGVN